MDQALLIAAGVLLSLGFIALVRWLHPRHELIVYGIVLAPTAGAYVFLTVINGATNALSLELLDVLMFGGLGLAGVWRWPVLIALGWAGHVAWGLALSSSSATTYAMPPPGGRPSVSGLISFSQATLPPCCGHGSHEVITNAISCGRMRQRMGLFSAGMKWGSNT